MIKAVLFDLDGTLLDTLDDLANSVNAVLQSRNYPLRTKAEIRRFIGNGVPTLMKRSLPAVSDAEYVSCLSLFHKHYDKHKEDNTRMYEGIASLLMALQERNIRMGVVTNKPQVPADILVNKFFPKMDVNVGSSDARERKPAPDQLLHALAMMKLTPDEVLYVGDTEVDIQTARNALVRPIGVTWGFRDAADFDALGVNDVIHTPMDLLTFID